VDQAHYVSSARAILDNDKPQFSRGLLLPGGGTKFLRELTSTLEQILSELRALEPPVEDAEALDRHFIKPLEDQALRFRTRLGDGGKRLSWRRALEGLDTDETSEDKEFCIAYGLVDAPNFKAHASFEQRARDADVALSPDLDGWTFVGDEQLRRIHAGGVSDRTLLILTAVLAVACGAFAIGDGTVVVVTSLVGGFVVFGWAFWRGFGRFGRAVSTGNPELALAFVEKRPNSWQVSVVPKSSPDQPVATLLTWRPRRKWRNTATVAMVVGDARPKGRFAVVFPDGEVLVGAKGARLTRWPPHPGGRP
jgi:hypothetical protein